MCVYSSPEDNPKRDKKGSKEEGITNQPHMAAIKAEQVRWPGLPHRERTELIVSPVNTHLP